MQIAKARILLQEANAEALCAADPAPLVTRALQKKDDVSEAMKGALSQRGALLVAVGKAAGQMLRGAILAVPQIQADSLCVTKDGHPTVPGVETYFAGHPLPDERSVIAAEALLGKVSRLGASSCCLLLLSGGASALLCAPRPPLRLKEKRQITDLLLRAGAPIEEINTVRKVFSRIKGGGLWRQAAPAKTFGLVLSDVVSGALSDVGSGPLCTQSPSHEEARRIFTRYRLWASLPEAAKTILTTPPAPQEPPGCAGQPTPYPEPVLICVGDRRLLLEGARRALERRGVECQVLDDSITGPVEDLAARFVRHARSTTARDRPFALLAVGEPTVRPVGSGPVREPHLVTESFAFCAFGPSAALPPVATRDVPEGTRCEARRAALRPDPNRREAASARSGVLEQAMGRGGRAQHTALLVAREIQGARGIFFLALGSDGTDGPTEAAGALVDGETWEAAQRGGGDPEEALASFDSEQAHRAAGTRLVTGPTGTNVNDLYVLLLEPLPTPG